MTTAISSPPPMANPTQQQRQPVVPSPPSSSNLDPSASPLPLSASQESQVRELYHKRVRQKCADEVRDFAACCTQKTFTATFTCRREQRAMNTCMLRFATQAERDAARAEWFATIEQRREERERKEEKKKVDEKFWREWWAKDRDKAKDGDGKSGQGKGVNGDSR